MDQTQIDTRWFQSRLADKRLSQRQLAKLMGLDPSAVSLMLRGKRKLSAAEAREIARLLGVEASEVLMRAGSTPTVPYGQVDPAPVELAQGAQAAATPVQDVGKRDVQTGMIELPVPMADGSTARLLLPRALGKSDAERIAALVQAIAMP